MIHACQLLKGLQGGEELPGVLCGGGAFFFFFFFGPQGDVGVHCHVDAAPFMNCYGELSHDNVKQ